MQSLPDKKGSYVLIVHLRTATDISVGSLGKRGFLAGYYAYVGSAMGGFKARLRRHVRKGKTPRWHIDYLTNKGFVSRVLLFDGRPRLECGFAGALQSRLAVVAGYGCSDCDCESHLFFSECEEDMNASLEKAIVQLQVPSVVLVRKDILKYLGVNRN